jgi:hypothetical protein
MTPKKALHLTAVPLAPIVASSTAAGELIR